MIINFENASYTLPSGEIIYQNLNLKVYTGESYGILGKNGAGKSTLIEMIMGIRKLSAGSIKILGEDVSATNRKKQNEVFVISHDMQIPGNISVKDLFNFYAFFYPNYSKELETKLADLFEISPQKKFGSLSTGQKIKALICAAFAARVKLYLLDEITAVLDPKSRKIFFNFLNEFKQEHETVILLATNIAEDLEYCMDKILFVDEGDKLVVKNVQALAELFQESA